MAMDEMPHGFGGNSPCRSPEDWKRSMKLEEINQLEEINEEVERIIKQMG